ncbi:hypothetical protein GBA52_015765 [Prunus armeniaca]|nr:hypothetical protein GBA52_015765 [Prunus armeniaca]
MGDDNECERDHDLLRLLPSLAQSSAQLRNHGISLSNSLFVSSETEMKKKKESLFVHGSDLLHLVFSILDHPEKNRREISKIVINKT